MDIIAGLRRRLAAAGRRRRPPRRRSPEVTPLEGRALLSVSAYLGFVKVNPTVLAPTNTYVKVAVNGQIASNTPTPPNTFYYVTDEYRAVEPQGSVGPLTLDHVQQPKVKGQATWYVFSYSFTTELQASRSTRTFDGRHYDLFVGATDKDGSDGTVTQIYVPKVYPPPTHATPAAATAHPKKPAHHVRGK